MFHCNIKNKSVLLALTKNINALKKTTLLNMHQKTTLLNSMRLTFICTKKQHCYILRD